jgi:hypothetical protein
MRIIISSLALLLAAPVAADDHVAILEQAFANISNDYHQDWAFTVSDTEDSVTTVGRYDPRLPKGSRWQLLTVDGRAPDAEEIADYQDDLEDEFDDDKDAGNVMEIIDVETLELIEETDEYWLFSFTPDVSDGEDDVANKIMQKIRGTAKVIRDGNYLAYIDMRSEKPVRPMFSVKISRFLTHVVFGPAGDSGPIVPLSIDVEVKGRAALVVKIDERESTRYSDYEYTGS